MGGSGGGTTTNTVTQSAPQIVPQGVPGYNQAQQFFQGLLQDPSKAVYQGPTVAPLAPGQTSAIQQAQSLYGGGPTSTNLAERNYLDRSLAGGFLAGPEAQAAVYGLAQPLFQQFNDQILPGIRDRAQYAGQGLTGTRRQVAGDEAVETLGRGLATGVVAPLYEAGLQNMQASATAAPNLAAQEQTQLQTLSEAGQVQQGQAQKVLDAARQLFQAPTAIQQGAANALFGAAGTGGGSGTSSTQGSNNPGTLGTIASIGGLGASSVLAGSALASMLGGKGAAGTAAELAPLIFAL